MRIDTTYSITLSQISALADLVDVLDGPGRNVPCRLAHGILMEVLGPDVDLVYVPSDGSEEEAAA